MTQLAIELNDAGITLVRDGRMIAAEPGYALLEGDELVVGTDAFRSSRLKPRLIHDRFWSELSLERLERPNAAAGTTADIAAAQLTSLWDRFKQGVEEVVLTVPATFDHEQLGLVLGIAQECGMPVRGVVDAAVAATERAYPEWDLVHLEAGLHDLLLTKLAQGDDVSRQGTVSLENAGLAVLRDRWVKRIAGLFLAHARFDPLHDAAAEQLLFNRLPACLDALEQHGVARVEIEFAGERHAAEFETADLLAATDDLYQAIARLVCESRAPGRGVVVQLGHRLAVLPSLLDALRELEDVEVVALEAGAASFGALASIDEIRNPLGRVGLTRRLGWRRPPAELPRKIEKEPQRAPASAAATHFLMNGVAHPVGSEPVAIAPGAGCFLVRKGGQMLLESEGRRDATVNGRPTEERTALAPGDTVRIGAAGVEVLIISVQGSHGA